VHVRREQCTIVDRWHVLGLRGTSSNEVVVDGAFVPDALAVSPFAPSRIDRALYRIPTFTTASCGGAAVALGIAAAAVDDLVALAATKTSIRGDAPLAESAEVQSAVAEAEIELRAARSAFHGALAEVTALAAADRPVPVVARARVRSAMSHAARTARAVTIRMFELGSSSAVYDDCSLSRRLRDVLVATQHVMLQPLWFEQAGRVLLGYEPTLPVL
jgi:alkylation response protein AidB-like acyl-CoA dehydrogenase